RTEHAAIGLVERIGSELGAQAEPGPAELAHQRLGERAVELGLEVGAGPAGERDLVQRPRRVRGGAGVGRRCDRSPPRHAGGPRARPAPRAPACAPPPPAPGRSTKVPPRAPPDPAGPRPPGRPSGGRPPLPDGRPSRYSTRTSSPRPSARRRSEAAGSATPP